MNSKLPKLCMWSNGFSSQNKETCQKFHKYGIGGLLDQDSIPSSFPGQAESGRQEPDLTGAWQVCTQEISPLGFLLGPLCFYLSSALCPGHLDWEGGSPCCGAAEPQEGSWAAIPAKNWFFQLHTSTEFPTPYLRGKMKQKLLLLVFNCN